MTKFSFLSYWNIGKYFNPVVPRLWNRKQKSPFLFPQVNWFYFFDRYIYFNISGSSKSKSKHVIEQVLKENENKRKNFNLYRNWTFWYPLVLVVLHV